MYITWITGVETSKWQSRAVYGCMAGPATNGAA